MTTGIISTAYSFAAGSGVHGVEIDPTNSFFFVTMWNGNTIQKVGPGRTATTVVGGGTNTSNGAALTSVKLVNPTRVS